MRQTCRWRAPPSRRPLCPPAGAAAPARRWRSRWLLHALAASTGLAAPWLIGGLVEDVQQGTTAVRGEQGDRGDRGVRGGAVAAGPLGPVPVVRARRAGAGRAARGVRRQRAGAADRHRRAGRYRRPAVPDLARRRRAVAHGAVRRTRDDHRVHHHAVHRGGHAAGRGVGAGPAARDGAGAGRQHAVVPAPRERRVPARERGVRADDVVARRDRRGRADGRGAAADRAPGAHRRPRHPGLVRRGAVHAVPPDGVVPGGRGRVPGAGRRHAAVRRLAAHPRPRVARPR